MARNISKDIIEQLRASRDDIAKILKARRCRRIGTPVSWFTPPGTEADEAKATVAMSAAMKEQELDVLSIHRLLSSSRFAWFFWKISSGVHSSRFFLISNRTEFCTYCIEPSA